MNGLHIIKYANWPKQIIIYPSPFVLGLITQIVADTKGFVITHKSYFAFVFFNSLNNELKNKIKREHLPKEVDAREHVPGAVERGVPHLQCLRRQLRLLASKYLDNYNKKFSRIFVNF